jgi:hypothetical protein
VLTLLMGLLLQIFSGTMRATQNSHRQMVASRQARLVLDPLRKDLACLVTQGEPGTLYVKQDTTTANATLAFLTRNRGPQGVTDYRFLAVAYLLEGTEMKRKSAPVTWTQLDLMTQALSAVTAPSESPLSISILRFQVMVVLDDGSTVPLSASGSWKLTKVQDQTVPSGFSALRLADGTVVAGSPKVRALTVAVAAMDDAVLRMPGATNIATSLPEPPAGKTPHESWNTLINSGALNSYPKQAVSTMRIVQVTMPLR